MKIVLCGSLKIKDRIIEVGRILEELGYEVWTPNDNMKSLPKRLQSRTHFDRITGNECDAILVVNEEKDGISNYIGPNSFAEIVLGFYAKKKVYLLNDYYEPYKDELESWNIIALKGNLKNIK